MLHCIATTLEKMSRSPVIPGRPVELPAGSPSLRGRRGSEDPREGSRPAGGAGFLAVGKEERRVGGGTLRGSGGLSRFQDITAQAAGRPA